MKLLLFDIDGTLLLTGGAGKVAFDKAFEDIFGIREIWKDIVPDGKTDPLIVLELLEKAGRKHPGKEEFDRLCRRYLEHFETEIGQSPRFRLMPGAEELIRFLSTQKGLTIGIATGNFEYAARLKLKRAGLDEFFGFGGYGSDSESRVELTRKAIERAESFRGRSFRKDEIYVIGDTVHDIRAGRTLATKTVAVATGSTTREILQAASPDHLFDRFPAPPQFLSSLS